MTFYNTAQGAVETVDKKTENYTSLKIDVGHYQFFI